MKRALVLSAAVLVGWLGWVSVSDAQVFIRVPFVRIAVGDGVAVRAPFVNVYVPPSGPVYYGEPIYGPRVIVSPPPPIFIRPMPAAPEVFVPPTPLPANAPIPVIPAPQIQDPSAPPQPLQPVQVMTHEAFARSFQPRAGSYDVMMINPISKRPTQVRFTLPEGTPRRVIVDRDEIEFFYGLRNFVRITFDREGAVVTSR